ncbi:hypothetical protein MKW94_000811 [Papaver nudicaule]|uniref:Uncharacterized protein n=1 Tax=Papaver nudicaule TaxID=74823 RepID=A0AA41SKQ3_PAPNU|nr:hypothetical protein [Papaver nudicaule]
MGRYRGGLSQGSSVERVDPLHNFVPERNPPAKQNTQANATRGKTSLPEISKRRKYGNSKPVLDVTPDKKVIGLKRRKYGDSKPVLAVTPDKKVIGLKSREFSLVIGMWVSQRENIPLNLNCSKMHLQSTLTESFSLHGITTYLRMTMNSLRKC